MLLGLVRIDRPRRTKTLNGEGDTLGGGTEELGSYGIVRVLHNKVAIIGFKQGEDIRGIHRNGIGDVKQGDSDGYQDGACWKQS